MRAGHPNPNFKFRSPKLENKMHARAYNTNARRRDAPFRADHQHIRTCSLGGWQDAARTGENRDEQVTAQVTDDVP